MKVDLKKMESHFRKYHADAEVIPSIGGLRVDWKNDQGLPVAVFYPYGHPLLDPFVKHAD